MIILISSGSIDFEIVYLPGAGSLLPDSGDDQQDSTPDGYHANDRGERNGFPLFSVGLNGSELDDLLTGREGDPLVDQRDHSDCRQEDTDDGDRFHFRAPPLWSFLGETRFERLRRIV